MADPLRGNVAKRWLSRERSESVSMAEQGRYGVGTEVGAESERGAADRRGVRAGTEAATAAQRSKNGPQLGNPSCKNEHPLKV